MDERLERHLCNLHNEVFEAAESRINTECSLIICEGISCKKPLYDIYESFPHYMWGYIVLYDLMCDIQDVPSLYVRVYLRQADREPMGGSSLIICEGISTRATNKPGQFLFPHYMWGYIAEKSENEKLLVVPSLYVRVYRYSRASSPRGYSSLIICEGISPRTGQHMQTT